MIFFESDNFKSMVFNSNILGFIETKHDSDVFFFYRHVHDDEIAINTTRQLMTNDDLKRKHVVQRGARR